MLELEKKLLLTKREYGILLNHDYFRRSAEVQKNYYYDTADYELNRKGITCRYTRKERTHLSQRSKNISQIGKNAVLKAPVPLRIGKMIPSLRIWDCVIRAV